MNHICNFQNAPNLCGPFRKYALFQNAQIQAQLLALKFGILNAHKDIVHKTQCGHDQIKKNKMAYLQMGIMGDRPVGTTTGLLRRRKDAAISDPTAPIFQVYNLKKRKHSDILSNLNPQQLAFCYLKLS